MAVQVVEKLKGLPNFDNWRFCINLILEERGLLDIVTGEKEQPADEAGKKDYLDKNRKAMIILASNVEASQMTFIKRHSLAKDAWAEINSAYQRTAIANQLFLRQCLRDAKQKEGEKVQDFAGRIRDLAFQLEGAEAGVSDAEVVLKLLEGVLLKYLSLLQFWKHRVESSNLRKLWLSSSTRS